MAFCRHSSGIGTWISACAWIPFDGVLASTCRCSASWYSKAEPGIASCLDHRGTCSASGRERILLAVQIHCRYQFVNINLSPRNNIYAALSSSMSSSLDFLITECSSQWKESGDSTKLTRTPFRSILIRSFVNLEGLNIIQNDIRRVTGNENKL